MAITPKTFATPEDYATLAETEFDGADDLLEKRLRSATIEVQDLIRFALYDVDENGDPSDPDDLAALTEATCAIVEYWEITDDPTGAEARAGAIKIGSVSLGTTSSSRTTDTEYDKLVARIGEKAYKILAARDLTRVAISHT